MKNPYLLCACLVILPGLSCGSQKTVPLGSTEPVVIYKTRKDYRQLLTVSLSADGNSISAYPAPTDVLQQKPIELADGYLLKRMVGDAYLSLSIQAYADTSRRFSADDLLKFVIDRDPYLEIYDCSGCTGSDTASINKLIRTKKLAGCKSLL